MTTFTATAPINLNSFYSSTSVFNDNPAAILAATATSYWFRLDDGTHLRFTGTSLNYNNLSFANGFFGLAPVSGVYNKLEVTDAAGNALATWSGFGDLYASDIVHNQFFQNYLGLDIFTLQFFMLNGEDTLTGSSGIDWLHGYNGNDTLYLTKGADHLFGDAGDDTFVYTNANASGAPGQWIDGGANTDTLSVLNVGSFVNANFSNFSFQSIEKLQFAKLNPIITASTFITINASSIGNGLASNLTVEFTPNNQEVLIVNATQGGSYSLENFVLLNSSFQKSVRLENTSNAAVSFVGTSGNDQFYVGHGGDSFAGGEGQDYAIFLTPDTQFTGTFSGGNGPDNFIVGGSFQAGTYDFTNATLSSFESLSFSGNGTIAKFSASQITALPSTIYVSYEDGVVLDITMAGSTSLNLSGWNLTSGQVQSDAGIWIHGGVTADLIVGSTDADRIFSGGGFDQLSGNAGDDFFVLVDSAALNLNVAGGADNDTLELSHDVVAGAGIFDLNAVTTTSVERLGFGVGAKTASITYANFLTNFAPDLQLTTLDTSSSINTFRINTAAEAIVDLSALTFGDWGTHQTLEIFDQNGFSAEQTFTGSSRNDFIFAGGGNDVVNGGNGDDILQGDIGADSLFGDAGNDTIYFDALDLAANVNGGEGFDTLAVVNGTLPGTYNLTAGSFEQLDLVTTDIFNNQSWDRIDNYYNLNNQLTGVATVFNNGTIQKTQFDIPATYDWQRIDSYYAAKNVLDNQSTFYDDNTRITIYQDYTNSNVWITARNDYNAAGQLTQSVLDLDSGNKVYEFYDVNNSQVWSYSRTDYNASFQLLQQVTFLDSGIKAYETFDAANTLPWVSSRTDYNAAFEVVQRVTVFDDNGIRAYEGFDPASVDAFTWSEYRLNYDDTFHLLDSKYVDDSGTYSTVVYDVANTETWSEWHRDYSATNVLVNEFFV